LNISSITRVEGCFPRTTDFLIYPALQELRRIFQEPMTLEYFQHYRVKGCFSRTTDFGIFPALQGLRDVFQEPLTLEYFQHCKG